MYAREAHGEEAHHGAQHPCVQVPVWADRVEEQFPGHQRKRQVVDVLAYGQHRRHRHIARLHDEVWYEDPQHGAEELPPVLRRVAKEARHDEERRHVEGIYHALGKRVGVAGIHDVERHHKQYQHTPQEINLAYPLLHITLPVSRVSRRMTNTKPRGCSCAGSPRSYT